MFEDVSDPPYDHQSMLETHKDELVDTLLTMDSSFTVVDYSDETAPNLIVGSAVQLGIPPSSPPPFSLSLVCLSLCV